MHGFQNFLESLRTESNGSLIEHIHQGFCACFEVESEADLTWEERKDLNKWRREQEAKPLSTMFSKYWVNKQDPAPEKDFTIPKNASPRRKPRYADNYSQEKIKKALIAELGGFHAINKKGKIGWKNFQIELNKRLADANLK